MYSDEEFSTRYVAALRQLASHKFRLDFGGQGGVHRAPPYLSGIAGCARAVYYEMVAHELGQSEGEYEPTHPWQIILGYAGQEIIAKALEVMGYEVSDIEKPVEVYGAVGRMDGKLKGLDLEGAWTWDSKLRNSFAIKDIVKLGIKRADTRAYVQIQGYIAHEGAEGGIITFAPYDVSDARSRLKQAKIELDPHVVRVVMEPDPECHEWIEERVMMLKLALEMGVVPAREYDPERDKFPCGFCPFVQVCLEEGDTRDYLVTPLLEEWTG